ncbi:MAG: diacylglycerol kinase family protein [Pseudomonadota bacterium]|nr:diacylglycerol kinase family protein [Pseudomonadota bacterium]
MDISRSPIHVLLNECAGSHESDAIRRETIERALQDAGREYRVVGLHPGPELSREILAAVTQAESAGAVVVAAGGDGTLNAVAQAMFGREMPFGILPQGTFNYFGREHGISQELPIALEQLLTGEVHPVQVGLVNGRVFLVNASIGLYPFLLEDREAFKANLGRNRVVALLAALYTLLLKQKLVRLTLINSEVRKCVRTPMLFVGNNMLQLKQFGLLDPDASAAGDHDPALYGVTVHPKNPFHLIWMALQGLRGDTAGIGENILCFPFSAMTVSRNASRTRRHIKVATDGEICMMELPLRFEVRSGGLHLIKPA